MTKTRELAILINCKGDDEEEYTGDAARERDHRLRDPFGEELGERGFGTGTQKRFRAKRRESGSRRPRFIPVRG